MGQLTLPASGSVYIDADAVIYSVEKIEPYWTLLQPMWAAAKAGQFAIIGSELLLLETLVKPFQTGDTTLEKSFRDLLLNATEVRLVPMSVTVLESAARLRAQLGFKTPDAIHAATALAAGCALFATNDKGFRRVSGLAVAVLSECITTPSSVSRD